MIPLLANIPAKLKTLTDRLTAARAANLDNIDATTMGRLDVAVSAAKAVRKTQVFTTSGTWTKPTVVDSIHVLLVAAGGGGGGVPGTTSDACGGGGGGGQVIDIDLAVTNDVTVTIGAGGAGGVGGSQGASGGNSTLSGGAALTAYGGTGGGPSAASLASRIGASGNGNTGGGGGLGNNTIGGFGAGAGGSPVVIGTPLASATGHAGVPVYGYRGCSSIQVSALTGMQHPGCGLRGYGGGGSGGLTSSRSGTTATSGYIASAVDGGGPGAEAVSANGGNAIANTGGGGGGAVDLNTSTAYNGGAGADGICIITWWE